MQSVKTSSLSLKEKCEGPVTFCGKKITLHIYQGTMPLPGTAVVQCPKSANWMLSKED